MATGGAIFHKKSCIIVTGASQGLGKCIAKRFAEAFSETSVIILMSRNKSALEVVKQDIKSNPTSPTVIVSYYDQGNIDQSYFQDILYKLFKDNEIEPKDFEQALIVHNAGTLGTKFVRDLSEADTVQTYCNINITGMILLNSNFLRIFPDKEKSRFVINLSSLAAVVPISSWSLYCSGKAARDMFFRVLALEDPSLRVLNYAPGPCETDMQKNCRETTYDLEIRKSFQDMHDQGKTLDCDTSISKLIRILELNTFKNGSHIDYYDDLEEETAD